MDCGGMTYGRISGHPDRRVRPVDWTAVALLRGRPPAVGVLTAGGHLA